MGPRAVDDVLRQRCRASTERSRDRRERLRRLRRRRLRTRGGTLSLVAMLLCVAVAGAGIASGRSGEAVLKRGDRGPAVARVQQKLGVAADGVFGPITERAVKRFQRRRGFTVDGVVGSQTRQALGLAAISRRAVRRSGALESSSSGSGAGGAAAGTESGQGARPTGLPRVLTRIARCESGGNPRAVSRNGLYRGKYQFLRSTWRALGGRGDPAAAPEWKQDLLALRLYRRSGTTPWANCA